MFFFLETLIEQVRFDVGILHTIVFHRALGLIRPKDIDLELFEITYVRLNIFLLYGFVVPEVTCFDVGWAQMVSML